MYMHSMIHNSKKMKMGNCVYYCCCYMIVVLVLAFFSMNVEGVRPLKDDSSSSFFLTLIMQRAYSGPSHRGRGH